MEVLQGVSLEKTSPCLHGGFPLLDLMRETLFGAVNLSYRMISRIIIVFFLIWLKCDPLPNYTVVVLLQDDDLVVRMIHHILPQVLLSFYLEGLGRGALTSGSKKVGGHGILLNDLSVCNSFLLLTLSSF